MHFHATLLIILCVFSARAQNFSSEKALLNGLQVKTIGVDTIAPQVTCPMDVTSSTSPGICAASGVMLGTPVYTDDCAVTSVMNDAPAIYYPGTTIVTWTVMDAAGNSATCMQNVIVSDQNSSSTISEMVCETYTSPSGMVFNISGTYTDVIPNVAGCDSTITINLTVNQTSTSTVTGHGCGSYTSPSGVTYNTSGIFTENLTTIAGCDSTVTVMVTVENIDVNVAQNGTTLTADWAGANSYQWIDCSDNSILDGQTDQSFDATENGSYAVIIQSADCIDTSACYNVNTVGVNDVLDELSIRMYPNPVTGNSFYIEYDGVLAELEVRDILGRLISLPVDLFNKEVNVSALANGKYFVLVSTEKGRAFKELMIVRSSD